MSRSLQRAVSSDGWLTRATTSAILSINTASKKLQLDVSFMDEATSRRTAELLTFGSDVALLRGVRLSRVLSQCGQLFASANGSAATYESSEEVCSISSFLSHNWVVPRSLKYVALSFHFNYYAAVAMTAAFYILVGLFSVLGYNPMVEDKALGMRKGCLARLLFVPCFLTCTFFLRVPLAKLGLHGPLLFLDKVCIHQTDADRQRLGILKLGAFLMRSKRLLIMYSDVYLVKLWTVYEVASFLAFRSTAEIDVVPVFRPMLLTIIVAFQYVQVLCVLVNRMFNEEYNYMYIPVLIAAFGMTLAIRGWHRRRHAALKHLAEFDVRRATCAVESDRQLVYTNIAAVWKAARLVAPDATEDQCLDAFNTRVREDMPKAFRSLLGHRAFGYCDYALVGFCGTGVYLADFLTDVPSGVPVRLWFTRCLFVWFVAFVEWPMGLLIMDYLSGCFLEARRRWQAAWLCLTWLFTFAFVFVSETCVHWMREAAETSDLARGAFVIADLVIPAACYACAARRARRPPGAPAAASPAAEPQEAADTELAPATAADAAQAEAAEAEAAAGNCAVDGADLGYHAVWC